MPTYATFDPTYTRSEIALSGGDLTATHGGPTTWASVAGSQPLDTGFGYVEITGTIAIAAGNVFTGLLPDGTDIDVGNGNPYQGGLLDVYGYHGTSGSIRRNGVNLTGTIGTYGFGTAVVSIRYDNHLFEMFLNGVLKYSTTVAAGSWRFYAQMEHATSNVTVNTGATTLAYPGLDTGGTGWSEGGGGGGICSNLWCGPWGQVSNDNWS